MKLYYKPGACSLVVRIVLNELGFEFDAESVDLATKKTLSGADFWKINPKGSVPVLITDKGETLTENAVILQYLADSSHAFHLLPEVGKLTRYRTLEWVNYITTELHKSCSVFFNPNVPEEMKKDVFAPLLKKRLDFVDNSLLNKKYLLGEQFTLPDAYLFVVLRWIRALGFDLQHYPNIHAFFENMKGRAAVVISLKEEGL